MELYKHKVNFYEKSNNSYKIEKYQYKIEQYGGTLKDHNIILNLLKDNKYKFIVTINNKLNKGFSYKPIIYLNLSDNYLFNREYSYENTINTSLKYLKIIFCIICNFNSALSNYDTNDDKLYNRNYIIDKLINNKLVDNTTKYYIFIEQLYNLLKNNNINHNIYTNLFNYYDFENKDDESNFYLSNKNFSLSSNRYTGHRLSDNAIIQDYKMKGYKYLAINCLELDKFLNNKSSLIIKEIIFIYDYINKINEPTNNEINFNNKYPSGGNKINEPTNYDINIDYKYSSGDNNNNNSKNFDGNPYYYNHEKYNNIQTNKNTILNLHKNTIFLRLKK